MYSPLLLHHLKHFMCRWRSGDAPKRMPMSPISGLLVTSQLTYNRSRRRNTEHVATALTKITTGWSCEMAKNILIPWKCPQCGKQRMAYQSALKRSTTGGLCGPCAIHRFVYVHGQSMGGPLYHRWNGIKQRCRDPHHRAFKNYGGRGISIYPDWLDFKTFRDAILNEIGPCPSPEHELDRIDNSGNYEPGNMRWATATEQSNNKRSNRILTLNNQSHTVAEWSRILNMNVWTLWQRLEMGWSVERTLTEPVRKHLSPLSRG